MASALNQLDTLQSAIATAAYQSVPLPAWESVRMVAKYSQNGEVGGLDFDYTLPGGKLHQESIPNAAQQVQLYALTQEHWQLIGTLGQPRWFKMIVTVQNSGKFSFDFKYKDLITEQDMAERG
jgi:Protein of unknown function, DUF600